MEELTVYVGRQPIFDRKGNIFGYELLYRNSEQNSFPKGMNPEQATVELLINTFLTIGIDQIVGKRKSFINFSKETITQGFVGQLDPRFVIIELLENVEVTEEILNQLKRLKKKGFKIALDDFTIREEHALLPELFETVHIIKVDFLNTDEPERRRIERLAKKYRHLTLLAEKIETKEQYEEAQKFGYLLFQGYYFSRPQIVKGKEIPPNYLLHFYLLKEFNEEVPSIERISELFMHDISLSYKLLRYINSLTYNIPHEVKSITHAIMLMGLDEAKRWLRILLLRELGVDSGRGKERFLINRSLVRAKLMELLAKHKKKRNHNEYFLAGLFSLIDVIMNNEREEILKRLSLSNIVLDTLIGEETEMTPYYRLAIAIESFDFEDIDKYIEKIGITEKQLMKYVQEAHHWATAFD